MLKYRRCEQCSALPAWPRSFSPVGAVTGKCTLQDAAAEIGHIFSHALLLDPEMQQLSISNTGSRARLDRALQKLREGMLPN